VKLWYIYRFNKLIGIKMTKRERVLSALNHREPDRIPIDFGATAVTGIHASCVEELRNYYGLEKRPVKVHEPYQMLGLIEEDLKEAMKIDIHFIAPLNYKRKFCLFIF